MRKMRPGRIARAHQPPRIFSRLLSLSRLRLHQGSFARTSPAKPMAWPKSHTAIIAARKWSSSAAVSASSSPAQAIRIARRRAASCRARKKRASPTFRSMKNAPLDDAQLLRRHGRFGEFIGCTNYPKCKYTRPITLGIKCPKCNEGEFVRRGISQGTRTPAAFSMVAAAIPIAISPRPMSQSTSRARSAPRPSSSKNARSRAISAHASKKAAIGKSKPPHQQKQQRQQHHQSSRR